MFSTSAYCYVGVDLARFGDQQTEFAVFRPGQVARSYRCPRRLDTEGTVLEIAKRTLESGTVLIIVDQSDEAALFAMVAETHGMRVRTVNVVNYAGALARYAETQHREELTRAHRRAT